MKTIKIYNNKFMHHIFGPLFGLLSVIIYFSGIILAFSLFTGFDFSCMISWLGGEYSPGAIYFNLGVFFSGILAIPLYIHIDRTLRVEKHNNNFRKSATVAALSSCVFFSLIGIFPSLLYNTLFYNLHGIFFLICLITAISYILLYSIFFLYSKYFDRFLSYMGFTTIMIIILFVLTWIPFIEWIMTFAISVWILSVSIYLLVKKH